MSGLLVITGQITGPSIAELVGGRQRKAIPLSFSVANRDFERGLECVRDLWNEGVRLFKLKAGFLDHGFELMRLEKLRELFGDENCLRIDYNQGLPAYDAFRRTHSLEVFST